MTRFENKVCLVTGAGGDIGRATAIQFAAEGAIVALFDIQLGLLEETAARIREVGKEPRCYEVDQTSREAVEAGVAQAIGELGHIDVLFANAGYARFSSFLETSQRNWTRHIDVNLTGTFNVCQVVARHMVAHRTGGAIVVTASSGATQYSDYLPAYCAAKAAVRMLAIGMASELGAHRIRVNAVLPGAVETAMTAPALADDRHRQFLLADTPVGRLGEPSDVARAVAFLASDDASYITGESVMVDGGQTIHGHPQWFRTDYRKPHQDVWEIGL
jgi:NAD(P)-dependent dehydrogenase (short-subunit alcohol dehydrogenase family)